MSNGIFSLHRIVIFCLAGVALAAFYAPVGFRGYDDLHYLQAAQDWIRNGVTVPDTHWAARLPYVLSSAASMKLFGISDLALMIPNALMFLIIFVCGVAIAARAVGRTAAVLTAIVMATTPFFFRMPTSYYPESMEVACSALAIFLALKALWTAPQTPRRFVFLISAGLSGGIAILVRETAIAVPLGLALLFFYRERSNLARAASDIAVLAAGYILPLLLEALFYRAETGNIFYRLTIDRQHVLIPSEDLSGHVFTGGSPFFNWHLAALWSTRHSFHVHWIVNPILDVLLSQELFFMPWLALGSFFFVSRFSGKLKDVGLLTCLVLTLQYVLNTFVIVIAPNVRYFGESIFLMSVMAGASLFYLKPALRSGMIILSCTTAFLIVTAQSSLSYGPDMVKEFFVRYPGPLYVSDTAYDRLYLVSQEFSALGPNLHRGVPPIEGMRVLMFEDFTFAPDIITPEQTVLALTCQNGTSQWQILEDYKRPSIYWRLIEQLNMSKFIPQNLATQLRRDYEHVILAKRKC